MYSFPCLHKGREGIVNHLVLHISLHSVNLMYYMSVSYLPADYGPDRLSQSLKYDIPGRVEDFLKVA